MRPLLNTFDYQEGKKKKPFRLSAIHKEEVNGFTNNWYYVFKYKESDKFFHFL